jgi:hypothetical protein
MLATTHLYKISLVDFYQIKNSSLYHSLIVRIKN